jgi:L-lactate dehydrogenase complex protein LldF
MNESRFRARVRKSLANETLQIALDTNAERRVNGRITAFESLPDWKEKRQLAHAVRADAIEHLEEYLQQFTNNSEQNGMTVHRAKDADEAIKQILNIVGEDGRPPLQKLIAKSKSMVTEEINLNHALEAEGMRVVETDLGEYIIQLRNEKPSHIITPAVHLRRQDVGQLFHEKLNIPYTEDIPTMTNTARKILREVFLTADVGISGVNFGVAETGGICLVTNEGNGRMVTSMPPLHIALMGMERLVRNLDDISLMLSLLPRSATGQKLSVYTQLICKPLAGQQRHIIILDNGRTKLRNSPLKESLLCIRCGACMNACPVFREIGGHAYNSVYPGPIGSVISAGLFGSDFVPLAQASTLCGACKDACPVDIDLPKLLIRVRAGESLSPFLAERSASAVEVGSGLTLMNKIFLRIYSRIARSPRLFTLSQKFASLGSFFVSPFSDYVRLPVFTGWGYSKDLPKFASQTFRGNWTKTQNKSVTFPKDHQGEVSDSKKSLPLEKETLRSQQPLPQSDINKVEQFIEELTKVSGQVIRTSENDVTKKVVEYLQKRSVDHIHLESNVLDEDVLEQAEIAVSHSRDAGIRVGVTKAICGLADTGSILEADGEGEKLFASLLPEIHLAILRESDIYPSLEYAIQLTCEYKSAVFITGPSRTGDIEMSHTIGVHGPGEVVVFLVP